MLHRQYCYQKITPLNSELSKDSGSNLRWFKLHLIDLIGVSMSNKIIGIVLIIVGVALAIWGYNIYESAGSQIGRALSGDTPFEAWAGMVGGAICLTVGVYKVM